MLDQTPSLKNLMRLLQQVPYLASKNLYRVASYFLSMNNENLEQFCAYLIAAKKNISQCGICYYWQEIKGQCQFCSSSKRDKTVICVVESWFDLLSIEQTQAYNGMYHVLGGAISPLEGISADNLTINALVNRCSNTVAEIILATNQTPEGEATAAYIAVKLKNTEIKISCLARGLPVGSSLGTMDRLTVYKALSERRTF